MDVLPKFPQHYLFVIPDYFNNISIQPLPGGLRVFSQRPDDPGFAEFIAYLSAYGYKLRKPTYMYPCDYALTVGSIEDHTDHGNGLTAVCLAGTLGTVHSTDDYYASDYSCEGQLITRSGTASLDIGGVVVFNSNVRHAWLSGNRCVLACVSVSRISPAAKPRR